MEWFKDWLRMAWEGNKYNIPHLKVSIEAIYSERFNQKKKKFIFRQKKNTINVLYPSLSKSFVFRIFSRNPFVIDIFNIFYRFFFISITLWFVMKPSCTRNLIFYTLNLRNEFITQCFFQKTSLALISMIFLRSIWAVLSLHLIHLHLMFKLLKSLVSLWSSISNLSPPDFKLIKATLFANAVSTPIAPFKSAFATYVDRRNSNFTSFHTICFV